MPNKTGIERTPPEKRFDRASAERLPIAEPDDAESADMLLALLEAHCRRQLAQVRHIRERVRGMRRAP